MTWRVHLASGAPEPTRCRSGAWPPRVTPFRHAARCACGACPDPLVTDLGSAPTRGDACEVAYGPAGAHMHVPPAPAWMRWVPLMGESLHGFAPHRDAMLPPPMERTRCDVTLPLLSLFALRPLRACYHAGCFPETSETNGGNHWCRWALQPRRRSA